jgi:acyl-CoA synthetase (AMP-forming)/AMP-acid ligase II
MELAGEQAAAASPAPEAAERSPVIADVPPGKPAVIMADGTGLVTYGELEARSRQVARLLASLGVGPADHVAIMLANRPEYFEIAWGAQRAGTYWTPVNWHLTAEEAAYIVADSGATVLFASPETAEVAARMPGLRVFVTGGERADLPGVTSYEAAIAGLSAEPIDPESGDAAEIEGSTVFYSSGTTGRPKGIMRAAEFPPFGAGVPLDLVMRLVFGFGPDSVYLCPGPLYHAAPLGFSMGTHRAGGTVVLMDRFDPAGCLRAIEAHQVTHTQFVPTHFVRMLRLPDPQRRAFDLSTLEIVIHAAAPCPVDVKQAMIAWFGPVIWEYYAGSEGNGMTVIGTEEWLSHPGSVGRGISGSVHILDEDGAEQPVGQDGLIYFDGGAFEYRNDPDKTAGSRNEQGWSTLGDIGRLDAEGFLYLSDRRTDLIISGGVNIYPREVEEALIGHPAVADVAVIGVPDPDMGQSVLAVVQPTGSEPGSADLAAELIAHCRGRLAGFKCPRSVEFVAELPRTPTGKLLRRQLRAERQPG